MFQAFPENSELELSEGSSISGDIGAKVKNQGEQISLLRTVSIGVIIVLFIGFSGIALTFGAILTDTWRYNVNSYIDYQESVKTMEVRFNEMEREIEKLYFLNQILKNKLHNRKDNLNG